MEINGANRQNGLSLGLNNGLNSGLLKGQYLNIASPYPLQRMRESLAHLYPLNGDSKDRVGILNGVDTAITYISDRGNNGISARFNGASSFVNFASRPYDLTSTNYSMSMWCRWDALNNALSYNENFNGTVVVGIGLRAVNGTIRAVGFANGGSGEYSANSGIVPVLGQWYHVTLTHQYNVTATLRVLSIYVDGVLKAKASPFGATPGNGNFWYLGRSTAFFNGSINDFRVYNNKVLDEFEVYKLYNNGRPLKIIY